MFNSIATPTAQSKEENDPPTISEHKQVSIVISIIPLDTTPPHTKPTYVHRIIMDEDD